MSPSLMTIEYGDLIVTVDTASAEPPVFRVLVEEDGTECVMADWHIVDVERVLPDGSRERVSRSLWDTPRGHTDP